LAAKLSNIEIHIRPSQSWLRLNFREIAARSDLLLLWVRRDFVTKYKQTVLGPAWFVLQPLLMTLVFTVIFGKVAHIPTDGLPPILFYLTGLLGWNYFAQTVNMTATTFTTHANIFQKVYFPRLIVPLSNACSNLFTFALQAFTLAVFWVYFKWSRPAGADISFALSGLLYLPLLVGFTALFALGVGLCMSAMTAKYRDLSHLTGFLIQIWMYATPVIYPMSQIPEHFRWVAMLNPMAAIIESFKIILLGAGSVSALQLFVSGCLCIVTFLTGVVCFQRTERTFVDTV